MTGTMRQIPDSAALNQLALATARRCGVDLDAVAGDVMNTSPVNGEPSCSSWATGSAVDDSVTRAQAAFLQWRAVPAPARGALVKRVGRAARRTQGRPRRPWSALEVGKITS